MIVKWKEIGYNFRKYICFGDRENSANKEG